MRYGSLPNCQACGRFTRVEPGVAWKMVYSGWPPTPDREVYKCLRCTAANGPFEPQVGIRPECSCGMISAPLRDSHVSEATEKLERAKGFER